jgi:hypothetical protein
MIPVRCPDIVREKTVMAGIALTMDTCPQCQDALSKLWFELGHPRAIYDAQYYFGHVQTLTDVWVNQPENILHVILGVRIDQCCRWLLQLYLCTGSCEDPLASFSDCIKSSKSVSVMRSQGMDVDAYSSTASWSESPVTVECIVAPPSASASTTSPVAIRTSGGPPRNTCA